MFNALNSGVKKMDNNKKLTAESLNDNAQVAEVKTADKKDNKKKKKPGFFAKIGKKLKEMFSELKQVSWPTLPKVIKQTGVVLVVVIVFLVCIGLFDWPLLYLLNLLTGK